MKQFIATLVVMVLATGSLLAQGNESAVSQIGSNDASVSQSGLMNYSGITQNTISPTVLKNTADVDQVGTKLSSFIDQLGLSNNAKVDQTGVGAGKLTPPVWQTHNLDSYNWAPPAQLYWGASIVQIGNNNDHDIKQSGGTSASTQNVAGIHVVGNGNGTGVFSPLNFPGWQPMYSIEQAGVRNWAWMDINGNNNNTAVSQKNTSNNFGEIWIAGSNNEAAIVQDGAGTNWAQLNMFPTSNGNRSYAEQHGYWNGMQTDVFGNNNLSCVSQFGAYNWDWTQIIGNDNLLKIGQYGNYNANNRWSAGPVGSNAPPWSTIDGNQNIITVDQEGNYNWVFFTVTGDGNNLTQPWWTVYQYGNRNKSFDDVVGDDNQFWSKQGNQYIGITGNWNIADLKVIGNSNLSEIYQLHDYNNADVDQYGDDNESHVLQNGNTNAATVWQEDGTNFSMVNQLGNLNSANVHQEDGGNISTVNQIGNGNSANVLQTGPIIP